MIRVLFRKEGVSREADSVFGWQQEIKQCLRMRPLFPTSTRGKQNSVLPSVSKPWAGKAVCLSQAVYLISTINATRCSEGLLGKAVADFMPFILADSCRKSLGGNQESVQNICKAMDFWIKQTLAGHTAWLFLDYNYENIQAETSSLFSPFPFFLPLVLLPFLLTSFFFRTSFS